MIVKLLTEQHLEFLSLTGGYTGPSESTHVKMTHCWKSHSTAQWFEYQYSILWYFGMCKIYSTFPTCLIMDD